MTKKTQTLEEALLQIKNIEDAMKQNAKGILESTMKQELKDLLNEEESDVTEEEGTEDMSVNAVKGMSNPKEVAEEEGNDEMDANAIKGTSNPKEVAEEEGNDEMDANAVKGMSNPKEVSEQGIDEFGDDDDLGDEENDGDLDNDDLGDDEADDDFGDDLDSDEDVFDMTSASDDEVLKVFKAMGPEDGIVVKKDGEKIKVDTGEEEFIIDLGEDAEAEPEAEPAAPEMDDEVGDDFGDDEFGSEDFGDDEELGTDDEPEMGDEEETEPLAEEKDGVLEIELDGECDDELDECNKVDEEDVDESEDKAEEDVDEAARTKWNPHGDKGEAKRAGLKNKKMFKAGAVNENYKKQYVVLKKQNSEYKKALGLFREKLNEVAIFNANLAYATRLFTEHSTTKQEKMNILERFDSVSTMDDSKKTYVNLKKELDKKTPVTENVADKITKSPSSSSSKEMLAESKAYENPQFKRMKDLMKKIK